jgi:hypothetical protein
VDTFQFAAEHLLKAGQGGHDELRIAEGVERGAPSYFAGKDWAYSAGAMRYCCSLPSG